MTESIDSRQNKIKVAGASGGWSGCHSPVAFLLGEKIAIDAGSLTNLGNEARKIEHIFLTHAHFDHILSIPFLLDAFFDRSRSLKLYALQEVLATLRDHIFNDTIWPDFSKIANDSLAAVLKYCPVVDKMEVEGYCIKQVLTDHTVPSCGYVIERGSALFISGDTYYCERIVETINENSNITTLFLECSYPSRLQALAQLTKHLTPQLVLEIKKRIERDVEIYIYHIKPEYEQEVYAELQTFGVKILQEGDVITF